MKEPTSAGVRPSVGTPSSKKTLLEPAGQTGADRVDAGVFETSVNLKPPSKDEIKTSLRTKGFRQIEYDAEFAKNRKAAIREVLQEEIQKVVRVTNKKLQKSFESGLNGRRD